MSRLIGFPETVDERAARTVAGGVVTLTVALLLSDRMWLTAPLAYGGACFECAEHLRPAL